MILNTFKFHISYAGRIKDRKRKRYKEKRDAATPWKAGSYKGDITV